jgi:uncharacterized oligopeptide transporter (OPT) family protein
MALFQTPPKTQEEYEQYKPLPIPPDEVLKMDEDEWYEKVYRGEDFPQLTVRAVLMGSLLGFLLAFTNLYVGLKTGWALGVAITACIVSYTVWSGLLARGIAKTPMTILETNCMQSTASSAGYSTGGTMVSAIAAMLMLSQTPDNPAGEHLPVWVLVFWTIFLAALGTLIAIPMKRNMINHEKLKFPSGTAAAVTLQSLYSEGDEAIRKGRALMWAAGIGSIFPLITECEVLIKERIVDPATQSIQTIRETLVSGQWKIFDWFMTAPGVNNGQTYKPSDWNMAWDVNPVMVAAGALVGMRVAAYMLISGFVLIFALGWNGLQSKWTSPLGEMFPTAISAVESSADLRSGLDSELGALATTYPKVASQLKVIQSQLDELVAAGVTSEVELRASAMEQLEALRAAETFGAISVPSKAWKELGLWLGVPIMLAYGLLQFLTQWRTILRALRGPKSGVKSSASDEIARAEVPNSWFLGGSVLATIGVLWISHAAFAIPYAYGLIAVALSFVLALVACRATGESDITPVGAMGKLMQLTFGTMMPQSTSANLMSASITANTAGSAADLLNDLKSGYLLGANPRRQFVAQFIGILAGTVATVGGFYLLVPDATVLGGDKFPAPAAAAWKAVAELMTGGGMANMHPMHRLAMFWGLGIGTACLALELLFKKQRSWLPSATGLGLGLILPFQYPLSMFAGALIAWVWMRRSRKTGERYIIPISAGLIAGIAIMGVIVAILNMTVFSGDASSYPAVELLGAANAQGQ